MRLLNHFLLILVQFTIIMFQSLFYWMRLLNIKNVLHLTKGIEFQSLFYCMRLLNYYIFCFNIPFFRVSILVLLDAPLEFLPLRFSNHFPECFNPCFIGCASWIQHRWAQQKGNRMFQSLFYWMRLLNRAIHEDCLPAGISFNPCFIGCASWILVFSFISSTLSISFNPCFIGCASWILKNPGCILRLFVSILVLLDAPLEFKLMPLTIAIDSEFQSLFYWMRLLNGPLSRIFTDPCAFQSLFYWMRLLNIMRF